jgi:hypothetical protein
VSGHVNQGVEREYCWIDGRKFYRIWWFWEIGGKKYLDTTGPQNDWQPLYPGMEGYEVGPYERERNRRNLENESSHLSHVHLTFVRPENQ